MYFKNIVILQQLRLDEYSLFLDFTMCDSVEKYLVNSLSRKVLKETRDWGAAQKNGGPK